MWDNHKALQTLASFLFAVASLALVYAGGYWLAHSKYFPVRQIRIDGQLSHITAEQLKLVAESELRGTFLTLNLDATRQAFEKLPWVQRAMVRRQWPDRLDIVITEYQAVARWGEAGLLSANGEWFDAAASETLPVVQGPAGSEKLIADKLALFKRQLQVAGLQIRDLHLSERQAWELTLDNGVRLALGRADIDKRLARFAASWKTRLAGLPYEIDYVDLRYPNGFAVHMPGYKPGSSNKVISRALAPA